MEAAARGAKRTVPSILVTLVGTVGIFSAPSTSVFASWHHRSKKINTGRKEHNFLSELWVQHGVSQLTVTRIGAGKSKFITIRKLSLTIKTTFSDEQFQGLLTRARSIATSLLVWQSKTVLKSEFYAVDSDSRFPIAGKKEAVEFKTIITLIPKEKINVHAYIITLRVLFQCSFPTQLKNDIQDRFTANRQIDNAKECSFFYFVLFRSSCSSRVNVL